MALLKLVKPDIDYHEYRDITFYNKYKYRARVSFTSAYYVKLSKSFDELLENTKRFVRFPNPDVDTQYLISNRKFIEKFIEYKKCIN